MNKPHKYKGFGKHVKEIEKDYGFLSDDKMTYFVWLNAGWSFWGVGHKSMQEFRTLTEARKGSAKKNVNRCAPNCPDCAWARK